MANETEDIPGMNFLNSAFDSSTIMNTNINCMKKFANTSNKLAESQSGALLKDQFNSSSISTVSSSATPTIQRKYPFQSSSIVVGGTISGMSQIIGSSNNSMSITNLNNRSQTNLANTPGKSSASINHFNKSCSISSKTVDEKASHIQTKSLILNSKKREYCTKTQIYCEAVSRALDIPTCKVVPFFSAFLHDLRFIIESVPSVAVVCDKNVQKPIEVNTSYIV